MQKKRLQIFRLWRAPPYYNKFQFGKKYKSYTGGGMNFKFNIHPCLPKGQPTDDFYRLPGRVCALEAVKEEDERGDQLLRMPSYRLLKKTFYLKLNEARNPGTCPGNTFLFLSPISLRQLKFSSNIFPRKKLLDSGGNQFCGMYTKYGLRHIEKTTGNDWFKLLRIIKIINNAFMAITFLFSDRAIFLYSI